jgi:hypothetical protein
MWNTESLWFEVALVSGIFALGNITMGHLEEQTPKQQRVGKHILTLLVICTIRLCQPGSSPNWVRANLVSNPVCSWLLLAQEKRN